MSSNRLLSCTFLLAIVIALGSCGPKGGSGGGPGGGKNGASEPDGRVELAQVEIPYYTRDGKTKWVVRAERITGETDEGAADLVGVECDIFEGGAKAASLRAGTIHIDYDDRALLLAGEVTMHLPSRGIDLECKRLQWSWSDGAFEGSGGVVLIKGDVTGRSEGARGSTRGDEFILF